MAGWPCIASWPLLHMTHEQNLNTRVRCVVPEARAAWETVAEQTAAEKVPIRRAVWLPPSHRPRPLPAGSRRLQLNSQII